ncbi:MAG TPA: energy-coupling factor ABC transporter permease [Azospira sp.]|nr:energy-coupling factor ABC transporter permease [Azospira sp.]
MNLPDGLLAGMWTTAAWLLFVPLFLRVVWRAPWRRLADPSRFNAWLGTIVVLVLLWSLNAGIKPGLSLHLVGAAVLALTFGPGLAFVGVCAALLGVTLNGAAGWVSFAANALLMGGVSVAVSRGVLRFSERFLPRQLFVYLFANGFFGAALSILAVGFAASGLLVAAGAYSADYVLGEYLPYVGMLAFSEAWLSGMVLTLLVVYRPQWVATFEDSRYLRDR